MINLFVDDIAVSVKKNATVLQACDSVGIEIPRFCFHERLLIAGNCRMCLVEIEKSPKPVASCTLPVMENMKVYTNTPLVNKARESVLEFLLLNHPLDCPICDQGGECDLQDQALVFGSDSGRFYDYKRGVENKNCGPLVKTIMTRCIHCTRCVRFATEIAGVPELGTTGRGKHTEIGTYVEKMLSSELSGNIIDLCPVGALTSKPYAFTARSWELESSSTIDVLDGIGSNIVVNTKGNDVMRVLPISNDEINEEWINDKTRFFYDGIKTQRITDPMILDNSSNRLLPHSWQDSLQYVRDVLYQTGKTPPRVGCFYNGLTDLETLIIMKEFLLQLTAHPLRMCSEHNRNSMVDMDSSFKLSQRLSSFESNDVCLLVDTNPRFEASSLNTRLRQFVLSGELTVAYIGPKMDLGYPAIHLGSSKKTLINLVEGRNFFCQDLFNAKNPIILSSDDPSITSLLTILSNSNQNFTFSSIYNTILSSTGEINGNELGCVTYNSDYMNDLDIVFLLNVDNIDFDKYKNSFIVYIGPHGNSIANKADVVLPSQVFLEKNSSYSNVEGLVQKASFAVNGPTKSRSDWKILRALGEICDIKFKFDNYKELHNFYKEELSITKKDLSLNSRFSSDNLHFESKFSVNNLNLKNKIEDFYRTDNISKSSKILLKCSNNRVLTNYI
jgi:NADH dehydrogenase (ubiquinone) Fe-S protein 1